MINFIAWLIFGALAGWVASILTGKNRKMGAVAVEVVVRKLPKQQSGV